MANLAPDGDRIIDQVEQFLEDGNDEVPEGVTVILFADIVDSTALTEQLGDAEFRKRARGLDDAMRATIRSHGGVPIEGKLLGDGVLAVFKSGREGIEAALGCRSAAADSGLGLHLGLHAGDVTREGNNVYGGRSEYRGTDRLVGGSWRVARLGNSAQPGTHVR